MSALAPVAGRAWVFGDQIDTDVLAPGAYMLEPIEVLASHCLEAIEPGFATSVQVGDVIVAGRSFGIGSSREQAVLALRHLGIRAIVAHSFARIFYRNSLALGLPVLICDDLEGVETGQPIRLDVAAASLDAGGRTRACEPLPDFLLDMLDAGGLIEQLSRQLAAERA
ncbi:MAG: 3-isopropylmalate dehydratase [Pseudomonadota bacterium]